MDKLSLVTKGLPCRSLADSYEWLSLSDITRVGNEFFWNNFLCAISNVASWFMPLPVTQAGLTCHWHNDGKYDITNFFSSNYNSLWGEAGGLGILFVPVTPTLSLWINACFWNDKNRSGTVLVSSKIKDLFLACLANHCWGWFLNPDFRLILFSPSIRRQLSGNRQRVKDDLF